MQKITTIADIRVMVRNWRLAGERIAFVPTMGNLHAGHLSLVKEAKKHASRVIVSIFVNPTQFGAGEDFATYPRTEKADCEKLQQETVDAVFLPDVAEIYLPNAETRVSLEKSSHYFCGTSREGHFDGVATVVCKLFNIVQPDVALFGQKDFQQLAIIRTMVEDLNSPVEIIEIQTVREVDGLAMSSRNNYLSAEQRTIAPMLYRVLCEAKAEILADENCDNVKKRAVERLTRAGFAVDYFQVVGRERTEWQNSITENKNLVILVAAKLGKTRLIDNIFV